MTVTTLAARRGAQHIKTGKGDGMTWVGQLEFGHSWIAFRGRPADNTTHAHPALQVTLATDGQVTLRGTRGVLSGPALIVAAGVPHAIEATGTVTLLLVEPHSPIACLLGGPNPVGIAPLSLDLADLVDPRAPLERCLDRLLLKLPSPAAVLEPRVAAALECLASDTSASAIARTAGKVGLSTSRLRALAAIELGHPMASWVIWRKLERAGKNLAAGSTLAEAAYEAGFADQAHLTRTMRKVLGITPRMLSQLAG